MQRAARFTRAPLAFAISLSAAGLATPAIAEEAASQTIEEVVVVGRLLSAAAQLNEERLDDEVVANLLGADDIARVGDSTVALALRRISGLTLVNNQFVYVRGLGERYSSTTLNGARIPSPDLTRGVVPLDLFPTTILDSLRVQKSYSTDQKASFGGGNIDIRTKSVPDGLTYGFEVGGAINTENSDDVFSYAGGDDDDFGRDDGTRALNSALRDAVTEFQGDISTSNILQTIQGRGQPDATLADAQAINRDLALLLNRNVALTQEDADPDLDLRGYFGNSFFVGNDIEVGFLVGGAYDNGWRETLQTRRNIGRADEQTDTELESTYFVNITGNANAGIRWNDEQEIVATGLFLRNTDDETAVRTFFNPNREISGGSGFQNYRFQYEEREVEVGQLRGNHRFGAATKGLLSDVLPFADGLVDLIPDDSEIRWYYSDSEARTDIPNQVQITGEGPSDPNGVINIADANVRERSNASDFRFTTLDDEVRDSGISFVIPYYGDDIFAEFEFGFAANEQARTYEQLQFELGPLSVADRSTLSSADLGAVFGDPQVTNTANNYAFERAGTNSESYIAATKTEAQYVKFDATYQETWRLSGGVRWEQYRQVGLDFNPFGFGVATPVVTTDPVALQNAVFYDDDYYPSLSLTYMDDWLAETFQFRLGYSETVTRPDLREITDASYVDPLTNDIVNGNPGVTPADVTNYDARAEWFFSNGDQFTVSLFYKDIENPIEFFEAAASDTNVAREIVNADSAEIYGVEVEFLKELGFIHEWLQPFFFQGNFTIQDSELIAGNRADAPTNPERELVNASPWVVNLQLGFDSDDGAHAATLVYNVYDERLFVAGRNGAPDGFEQPLHQLDMTYQWYPTDTITVRGKIQNLLDDTLEIERAGIVAFEQDFGRTISLSVRFDF